MNIIDLTINLATEEASVSYPKCILWATVYPVSYCVSNRMSHIQDAAYITLGGFERGLSTSWWMQIELSRYQQGKST